MKQPAGTTVILYAFYTHHGGYAAPGLAVAASIKEDEDIISDVDATDDGDGWYHIFHTMTKDARISATFHCYNDGLDAKDIPALGFDIRINTEDISYIGAALNNKLDELISATGYLIIGRGRGSKHVTDVVSSSKGAPIQDVTVKAYEINNGEYIWNRLLAMDSTDDSGRYNIYLNPGHYILSVELDNIQITTQEITVV